MKNIPTALAETAGRVDCPDGDDCPRPDCLRPSASKLDMLGQLLATWISQQCRFREIARRKMGIFSVPSGGHVVFEAAYHAPEAMTPQL